MGYSVYKINFDKNYNERLYSCIENINDAEILGQLAMTRKMDDELIFISAGWNRGINKNPTEYEKALQLEKEYKEETPIQKLIIEWCPHCEQEVEILSDKPSKCPNCGAVIKPCSMCEQCVTPCKFDI